MMLRETRDGIDYGLVSHVPSGEVYVMRFRDGAIYGPIHYGGHLAILGDGVNLDYDPFDTEWAAEQEWESHNQNGSCRGCAG